MKHITHHTLEAASRGVLSDPCLLLSTDLHNPISLSEDCSKQNLAISRGMFFFDWATNIVTSIFLADSLSCWHVEGICAVRNWEEPLATGKLGT